MRLSGLILGKSEEEVLAFYSSILAASVFLFDSVCSSKFSNSLSIN